MEIGAHSKISPSSAYRWVHCPGSVFLQSQFKESTNQAAKDGNASHWVGATLLEHIKKGSLDTFNLVSNFEGAKDPDGTVVNSEMVDNAVIYVRDVTNTALQRGVLPSLNIEQKIHAVSIHPESWGTIDCWVYDPLKQEIILWDYKFGYKIVEVFRNWQLINYAAGIIDTLRIPDQYLTVTFRLVQPRPYHPQGPVRNWTVPAVELRPFKNQLHYAAGIALSPSPEVKSGDHCQYCTARHACVTAGKAALSAIDYTESANISEITVEALGRELEILQRASKAIEYRLSGLVMQAIESIKRGQKVDGYRLEPGAGRVVWDKPAGEIFALGELMGIDLKRKPEPITPKQAIGSGMNKNIVKAYSRRESGSLKLIPDDGSKAREVFKR